MSHSLFDIHHRNFEQYYNQNKDKDWTDWLIQSTEHRELNSGKQGYTGILQHPTNKNMCCLYKISKVDDRLVEHEYKILKNLEPLSKYCPHFHNAYGILPFHSNVFLYNNPLKLEPNEKILKRNMLLMQYISNKYDFHEMIQDENIKDICIINIIKQIILAIYLSHSYKFTHYDLHSENILVRNCNPNLFILYILDTTEYLIPTNGFIANIIDFGFAYCDNNPELGLDNSLTCTLVHTQQGFTSTRFDPWADIKLFLVSVADDIRRDERRNKMSKKFLNIVRNIFSGMKIQWSSGWDNSNLKNPVFMIQELIKEHVQNSVLFSKSDLWFESIQTLIDLPLNPMEYHNLETCFKGFIEEFVKFEERIASKTLLNYILGVFVKIVKEYRLSYLKGGEEAEWAIFEIKKAFLEEYTQIVNYHTPCIDYDKMVCCLLLIAQCLEGLFYEYLEKRYEEKDKQYEIMRMKNILDFYNVIHLNFQDKNPKSLTVKSNILVVDHTQQTSKTITLSKEEVNNIQNLYNSKNKEYDLDLLSAKYIRNIYLSKHL